MTGRPTVNNQGLLGSSLQAALETQTPRMELLRVSNFRRTVEMGYDWERFLLLCFFSSLEQWWESHFEKNVTKPLRNQDPTTLTVKGSSTELLNSG